MLSKFRRATASTPVARTEGLSVTISGDETLVYDKENFVIHRLNADTASVWQMANGTRGIIALAAAVNLPVKTVQESLQHLVEARLITPESVGKSAVTRRRLIGGAAGAAAAVTFISRAAASPHVGGACDLTNPADIAINGTECGPPPHEGWGAPHWACENCQQSNTNCEWYCH